MTIKNHPLTDAGFAVSAAARTPGHHAAVVAIAWFAMVLTAPAAHAQGAQIPGGTVRNSEIGHSTEAWLALQRSNAQAAPALPMLGAEAGYAYQRYLNSFDTAIPASFGSTVQSGGGQGGGGGAASAGGGGAY